MSNSLILTEVCEICLRPINTIRSHTSTLRCVNCARTFPLRVSLHHLFRPPLCTTLAQFRSICTIRHTSSTFALATCPICHSSASVRGVTAPTVTCRICNISLKFNGKVIATDTLTDQNLPYFPSPFIPFENTLDIISLENDIPLSPSPSDSPSPSGSHSSPTYSTLLDKINKLRELNLL